MGDLVRGEVIRRLRKERHWKQQQVVDLLKEQEGATVVRLRRYQNWEASTPRKPEGIEWENALALAKLFDVEVGEFVYRSADDSAPDLMASLNGDMPDELRDYLDRIDAKLDRLLGDEATAPESEDEAAAALTAAERLVATEDEAEPDAGRSQTPRPKRQRRSA